MLSLHRSSSLRSARRGELLRSKHFLCQCERCVEPVDKSVDRFLDGYVCRECNTSNWGKVLAEVGRFVLCPGDLPESLVAAIGDVIHSLASPGETWLDCVSAVEVLLPPRMKEPKSAWLDKLFLTQQDEAMQDFTDKTYRYDNKNALDQLLQM